MGRRERREPAARRGNSGRGPAARPSTPRVKWRETTRPAARETAMKTLPETPYSVLDLAPVREGGSAAESFRDSLDLARHAERWGYRRFWLAEHHGLPGVASAATAVVIAHVAGGTEAIRVGAGGVML